MYLFVDKVSSARTLFLLSLRTNYFNVIPFFTITQSMV